MGVDTLRSAFPTPTSVDRPEVSLIVPVYNEAGPQRADAFRAMLDGNLTVLDQEFPGSHELLVIDDGSTDGTAQIAHDHGVTVLTHSDGQNHGKGASVRLGMLAAKGDSRVMADADGSYSSDTILRLVDAISRDADVAVASRESQGHASLARRAGHALLEVICQHYAPTDTSDTQAGAKAFTAEAAEAVWSRVVADRFAADREAMYLAKHLGFRAVDVPAQATVVEGSHVRIVRDTLQIIRDTRQITSNHPNL